MRTMCILVILSTLFLFTNLTAVSVASPISVPGLFDTGVDNQGVRLPDGSLEQHYSLTDVLGVLSTAYVFHESLPDPPDIKGFWVNPAADAMWIGPYGGTWNAPVGDYVYTLTFDLSGFNLATMVISGQWSSDNDSEIYLNGVYTGTGYNTESNGGVGAFTSVHPFSIDSGFLPTINTLEFHVNNVYCPTLYNPTGLLVQNLQATPEPCTLLLLELGALGLLRNRRFR